MSLYLGFDCSTQSLTAIVLDATDARARVVFESSLQFDTALPQYRTRHGVLPPPGTGVTGVPGVAVSSPLLWADALDTMMARVARGVDLRHLQAIAGSAQQHGSVYMNDSAVSTLGNLDVRRAPGEQLAGCLSRAVSPIWMDSSTTVECDEIARAVGGASVLAARTGSRAFERFTGPQIRRFYKNDPRAFAATDRIHLVSSFLASLLAGRHAPVDPGDASGTNLMDLETNAWWPPALEATAPSLARKLPPIAPSWTIVGEVSRYWRERHGLPPARVVAWSGDNPCSLIGTGLVREGLIAVSLGTSDTVFGLMPEPRVDRGGTGHVFGAPTGGYMALTCFANGSLAREGIRDAFGLTWSDFSAMLASTPAGNRGRVLLPWFDPEITPAVSVPGIRRYGLAADDGPGNVRGVVEAQMMSMALHSQWMGVEVKTIHATGGASANREILQVMADVFDAGVSQLAVENSACLGAALRARHADALASGQRLSWDDVVRDVVRLAPWAPGPPGPSGPSGAPKASGRFEPDPSRAAVYRELLGLYAACEAHALGR